jgi:F0F1-type ATP synthase assembly protein I
MAAAIPLALSAALLYAISAVLQQKAAAEAPASKAMRPSLMFHLLRQPRWLLGYTADWAAFGCEAVALGLGSLIVVQPLLSSGLLFALLIDARWFHRPMSRNDWLAAGALTFGLVAFIAAGAPEGGVDQGDLSTWLTWGAPAVVIVVFGVIAGFRTTGTRRAVLFALTTGAAYGLTAALTKTTMSLLGEGIDVALTSWEPYALAAFAGIGMLANQSAFQAGSLTAAMPTQVCTTQVIGVALGIAVFEEHLSTDTALEWAVVVLAIAAMGAGVIQLARSAGAAEEAMLLNEPRTASEGASSVDA